jgi:hypothetical protein
MTSRFLLASAFSMALLAQFSSSASAATITLINEPSATHYSAGDPNSPFQRISIFGAAFVTNTGLAILGGTEIESKSTFAFNTGDVVNLSFNYVDDGGTISLGSLFTDTLSSFGYSAQNPFTTYTKTFTVQSSESAKFSFLENAPRVAGGTIISNFLLTNTTAPAAAPTSVPEPFTVIGTLVGGTAAIRMRKKLKLDRK